MKEKTKERKKRKKRKGRKERKERRSPADALPPADWLGLDGRDARPGVDRQRRGVGLVALALHVGGPTVDPGCWRHRVLWRRWPPLVPARRAAPRRPACGDRLGST